MTETEQKATQLTDLASDILLVIFLNLDVEDVLALTQSCRVLYAIGSLDYLWHKLVRTCNLPLDIPLGADSATLSGQELQAIVVKALKLDHNWRKPGACIERAIPTIPGDKTPMDSMHLLPGGKWLITTQLVRRYTHQLSRRGLYAEIVGLTLWCLGDISGPRSIKTIPIYASVTSCRAYYQSAQHKVIIAVALQEPEEDSEWFEVYHISLDDPAVVTHSEALTFQHKFASVFNIDNLRIYEDVLGATFYHQIVDQDHIRHPETGYVYLRNLVTGAAASFELYDKQDGKPCFELLRDQFALTWKHDSEEFVSFYDVPPSIISANLASPAESGPNHMTEEILSARCRLSHCNAFSYRASSGSVEHGIPIFSTMTFDSPPHNILTEHFSPPNHETRFSDCPNIATHVFPHPTSMIRHLQLGVTGRRAVWVDSGAAVILKKWTSSRYCRGEELSAGTSELILPFYPDDIHQMAFDEGTCRLCVSLCTGELYQCDFLRDLIIMQNTCNLCIGPSISYAAALH
ncbi:hypothetical protein BJ138DRAFT_1160678 [Hygrophoropsis aurantiaca]|uniref:Uncharacterized protein n=1 Tax=Hygrophoropsis aurantiaca TaxID=72124 RepID=A0ACB8A2J4_9AGAM|nr:hypothetical protein BJ138DRAFT_1160678 [Hygrophoropsis aurantiaca]